MSYAIIFDHKTCFPRKTSVLFTLLHFQRPTLLNRLRWIEIDIILVKKLVFLGRLCILCALVPSSNMPLHLTCLRALCTCAPYALYMPYLHVLSTRLFHLVYTPLSFTWVTYLHPLGVLFSQLKISFERIYRLIVHQKLPIFQGL